MQASEEQFVSSTLLVFMVLLIVGSALPVRLHGQTPGAPIYAGDAAVYSNTTGTRTNSHAYIDASVSTFSSTDFCQTLASALAQLANGNYRGGAGVIDTRGINPASMTCNANPWASVSVPATVLLPTGLIKVSATWILPSGTHLVGEGGEDPTISGTAGTTLQAQSNFGPILQMGSATGCTGVSVEDLVLDGHVQGNDGIDNQYCQELTYVNHVSLYQITGIGLKVFGNAQNSGPYSNITFDTAGVLTTTSTTCVELEVTTRGLQAITCTTNSATATVPYAIYVDSSNNSVEDVRIEGFTNGVIVGYNAAASGNVLRNILGDSSPRGTHQVVSVIDISTNHPVTDLAVIGVANNCTGSFCSGSNAETVSDHVTGTTLHFSTDPFVAMYVLGKQLSTGVNGYSLYTTSPEAVNWSVGTIAPTAGNTCILTNGTAGSLYSNTGSGTSLWVCTLGNGWQAVQ
jgi:hypothetical protein